MPSCECLVYFMDHGPLKGDPRRREGGEEGMTGLIVLSSSLSFCLSLQSVLCISCLGAGLVLKEDGFVCVIYS